MGLNQSNTNKQPSRVHTLQPSFTYESAYDQQPYKYVIVVDFEATVFDTSESAKRNKQEIIEFPAVLMNLQTGKVEDVFHKFVKPTENPKLSKSCVGFIGITQHTVDNSQVLEDVLDYFDEWLHENLNDLNLKLPKPNDTGNCAFVTWGESDFNIFLHRECERKQIYKQPYFNQFIDLRKPFMKFYNIAGQPKSLLDALAHVGMQFLGRRHSGIDDATNTARLSYKMVCDGVTLKLTN